MFVVDDRAGFELRQEFHINVGRRNISELLKA